MLELLASAKTPEELAAIEALLEKAEQDTADAPRGERVPTQKAAAEKLHVARTRLRDWELNAPWWKPEFRTSEGYDIAAIAAAQAEFNCGRPIVPEGENWSDRSKKAKALTDELELKQRLYEFEKEQGNILPADVYASFTREFLGMVRKRLEEIPLKVSRNCSPSARSVVYNEKGNAPLQREIEKLITDVTEWLKKGPEEEGDNANG